MAIHTPISENMKRPKLGHDENDAADNEWLQVTSKRQIEEQGAIRWISQGRSPESLDALNPIKVQRARTSTWKCRVAWASPRIIFIWDWNPYELPGQPNQKLNVENRSEFWVTMWYFHIEVNWITWLSLVVAERLKSNVILQTQSEFQGRNFHGSRVW